ncbi:nuclease-related domain-containing protein [Desemzia incerta]|uniref:nuclease-related domain-containing protein n=1 Tax=Desemzia incerta TaxID=82801 RepID=UPI003315F9BE
MIVFILLSIPLFIFYTNYREYNQSRYRKVSNHTYWETFFNKGNSGEYYIYRRLEHLKISKLILTNLYIPKKDGSTTEVDLLMITKYGFFVVESKNYQGWIFGDEKHRQWTQTFPNKKKFKFFNPIWQNKGHISALKEVLGITEDSLIQSLIVFSNECELKKITLTSENVHVLKRNQLNSAINRVLKKSHVQLSADDIKKYYHMLSPYIRASKEVQEVHIQKINEKLQRKS